MSLLLDTCALIWLGNGDPALSLDARQMIEESEMVYVSPISLWEGPINAARENCN